MHGRAAKTLINWFVIWNWLVGAMAVCSVATADHSQISKSSRIGFMAHHSQSGNRLPHTMLPEVLTYRVKQRFQHDPGAFTQGLVMQPSGDGLYESTGLYGRSKLKEVDLISGETKREVRMGKNEFGEGLTLFNNTLYQLLYETNHGFIYDPVTLNKVGEFNTPLKTGWGICPSPDGTLLAVTDGSEFVYYLEPSSFALVSRIQVHDKQTQTPVKLVNELELVDGEIWANVWFTECIARIDPNSGSVNGWLLLHGLRSEQQRTRERSMGPVDVLNGIAYHQRSGRLFVTGKLWHTLFEIELREPDGMLSEQFNAQSVCIPYTR